MMLLIILSAVVNVCLGFLIGYIRGRLHNMHWDEEREKFIYLCGWRDGLFYSLDEYDEQLYIRVRPKAVESYLEFKGYPHNRKH